MLNRSALEKIVGDPNSTEPERDRARRQLGGASDDDNLSPDATAMLAALGKPELAYVTDDELDAYCRTHRMAASPETIKAERSEYLLPPDDALRLLYLADPQTDIHWAYVAHWRTVVGDSSNTRVCVFALRMIQVLSKVPAVPPDVRAAAGRFLTGYTPGAPLPTITLPDAHLWKQMPDEELYARMETLRSMLVAANQ